MEFEFVLNGTCKEKRIPEFPLISPNGIQCGSVEVKEGKAFVSICMPKATRNDNIKPFVCEDMEMLEVIIETLNNQLSNLLSDSISCRLKKIECNITQKVAGNCTCSQVLDLLNTSFNDHVNVIYEGPSASGKYNREKQSLLIKVKNYYHLKCYNKTLDAKRHGVNEVEDELLRIEVVMQDRVIKRVIGNKQNLQDVLQEETLIKVIEEYKRIFLEDIVDGHVKPCLNGITDILVESLFETNNALETIALNRSLIIDQNILRKALKKWYEIRGMSVERAKRNSDKKICDLKKYKLPRDAIKTISEFKKQCM